MKKIISLFIVLICMCALANAEFDISNLKYSELIDLRDKLNLAIWNSKQWKGVTVPQGVYQFGVDIPSHHWTIRAANGAESMVTICYGVDNMGQPDYEKGSVRLESLTNENSFIYNANTDKTMFDQEFEDGMYMIVDLGSVVLSPYSGKPSFDFSY